MGAPLTEDIVGYSCDVGLKSLLRSICVFYEEKLRHYLGSIPFCIDPKKVIEHFVASEILIGKASANQLYDSKVTI